MGKAISIGSFNYQDLFDGLTMSIESHKLVAISGPNNCGKTTLIRILGREIIVESDIEVEGYPINIYAIEDYQRLVKMVIPMERIPLEETIEEEMYLLKDDKEEIEEIIKGLKIQRISNKPIHELTNKEFIYYQIAVSLITQPKILLLDSLDSILLDKECIEILEFLKEYQKERDLTVVYTTLSLNTTLISDYLYVLEGKQVALKGTPLEVLKHDNIINKIGLNVPFMVDLSVKLKDYDLIDKIELDKDRMLDALWK